MTTLNKAAGSGLSPRIVAGIVGFLLLALALASISVISVTGRSVAAPRRRVASHHHATHVSHRRQRVRSHRPVHHPSSGRRRAATHAIAPRPHAAARPRPPAGRRAAPGASLVLHIGAVTTPSTMQAAIDACRGPVEIVWHDNPPQWSAHPTEIAEHNYCGGSAFEALSRGERVEVIGGGLSGTYVVNGNRRDVAYGSSANQLNGIGDISLQTCLSGGMVLIGLSRVA